ncbi:hydroxymethylpyrimidine/phosphomethylpyrimidine kinase [Betaproteobacteria bacterium SCGC AG-212-J23]|nr:hydroxymethylpyrimidine/phosphomethylpyrimidine kinase [Betaproteobacteria bacterium SCGC AG-212-J23]
MPPLVLTFAASDPTGGAGLQADLLTLAALGCHPLSVVTGITVQDTRGVDSLDAVETSLVERQAAKLLAEMKVSAFKLGVLGSAANARAIAAIVSRHPSVPLVLDPVLASGRGDPLASEELIAVLLADLVPRATLATPNSIEAQRLGGSRALLERGCKYVLVTGTHDATKDVVNVLHDKRGKVREDRWPRLPGSYHGSGCTLASAIAAKLAHGLEIGEAARAAQDFTWRSLSAGFRPAEGQFVPWRK